MRKTPPIKLEYETRREDAHHLDVILSLWFQEESPEELYVVHCDLSSVPGGSGNYFFEGIEITWEHLPVIQKYPELFEALARCRQVERDVDQYSVLLQILNTLGFTQEKGRER